MPPSKTTTAGNIYIPNSYQKPNAFVDELMALLSPAANVILDVACRKILGWDEHRATRRDRISISQFMDITHYSRPTVITAVSILDQANILKPIGRPTSEGQEYELNLGQLGDYDLVFLNDLPRRSGNPTPDQSGIISRRNQLPLEQGGKKFLPVKNLYQSNEFNESGELVLPQVVNSFDTQKPKPIKDSDNKLEIDSSVHQPIPHHHFTPLQVWQAALGELQLQLTKSTYDTWLKNTQVINYHADIFTIAVENNYTRDWLTNRLLSTIERTLRGIVGDQTITVELVVCEVQSQPRA